MKFFKDEDERNLWLRLNAEHIRYSTNIVNETENEDLGNIETPYSPYWVSHNQLMYDEKYCDAPRLTLEELSSLSHEELFALVRKKNRETLKRIMGRFYNSDDEL